MVDTFDAQLLTPEGALFEGEVFSVQLPGSDGSFQVLHDHAPIVSTLQIGRITIQTVKNRDINYAVSGGFIEMNDNKLTILAEKAEEASEIDIEEAKKARDEAKKILKETTFNREEAEHELAKAENRVKIAG